MYQAWEYMRQMSPGDHDVFLRMCNLAGQDGWELTAIVAGGYVDGTLVDAKGQPKIKPVLWAYFKRPVFTESMPEQQESHHEPARQQPAGCQCSAETQDADACGH